MRFVIFWFLFVGALVHAQSTVEVLIEGSSPGTPCILGHKIMDRVVIIDTVLTDDRGYVLFDYPLTLKPGVFFLTTGPQQIAVFLINGQRKVQLKTYANALNDSLQVVHPNRDIENERYLYFSTYVRSRQKRLQDIQAILPMLQSARAHEAVQEQMAAFLEISQDINTFTRAQARQYEHLMYGRLLQAGLLPEPPAGIAATENGRITPGYLKFLSEHYWQGYPFYDTTLIHSDVLPRRLEALFNQYTEDNIAAYTKAIDLLMAQIGNNMPYRKEVIRWLITKFENPAAFLGDTLMAHLFDHHIPTPESAGIDVTTWQRIQYKVNVWRPTFYGKVAPNIVLPARNGIPARLHDVQTPYTLLYFFNPRCEECREITPRVAAMLKPYLDKRPDEKKITVFAVSNEPDIAEWHKFCQENQLDKWLCVNDTTVPSTYEKIYAPYNLPYMLLLDPYKHIVIKAIDEGVLAQICRNLLDNDE